MPLHFSSKKYKFQVTFINFYRLSVQKILSVVNPIPLSPSFSAQINFKIFLGLLRIFSSKMRVGICLLFSLELGNQVVSPRQRSLLPLGLERTFGKKLIAQWIPR